MGRLPMPKSEELYEFYVTQGKAISALSLHYGVSKTTISHWLERAGVRPRKRGKRPLRPEHSILFDLYITQSLSTYEIATKLGVTASTIGKWLAAAGIKARAAGWPRPGPGWHGRPGWAKKKKGRTDRSTTPP